MLRFKGRRVRVRRPTSTEDPYRQERSKAIREHGPANVIYISHGAGPEDWFVVEPQVGTQQSMAGTPIDIEMAVGSLIAAGRTVYRVEVSPWGDSRGIVRARVLRDDAYLSVENRP